MFVFAKEDQRAELESLGYRYIYEQILNGIKYYIYRANGNMNFDKSKYIVSNTMYF